jgi:hypothetical protein
MMNKEDSMQMPPLSADIDPSGVDLPDMNMDMTDNMPGVSPVIDDPINNQQYMQNPVIDQDLDNLGDVSDSEIIEPSAPAGSNNSYGNNSYGSSGMNSMNAQMPDLNSQLGQNQSLNSQVQYASSMSSPVDYEDVNKLFVSDDWKEPDWTSYDPYSEEKIDEPSPEDFGMKAPSFEDSSSSNGSMSQPSFAMPSANDNFSFAGAANSANMQMPSNNENNSDNDNDEDGSSFDSEDSMNKPTGPKFVEPTSPRRPTIAPKPVELFIKGKAYARVFTELDAMNTTLAKIDSKLGNYEDIIKRQEPLINTARDQMENLYKKLNTIDKKIFTQ